MRRVKKSYFKIYIFEIIVLLILLLNSFESSILSNYKMPSFILLLILIFKFMLGLEKEKSRYKKDLILNILIESIIFYIYYYLLGLVIGFARNENYLTFYGIIKYIIPLIITIVAKEFLRYSIVTKCGNNIKLILLTIFTFIMFDISGPWSMVDTYSSYSVLVFLGLTLLPSITKNLFLTYLCYKDSYKPALTYQLIMVLPMYIFSIIPNPSPYVKSIIDFLIPVYFLLRTITFYNNAKVINEVDRDYNKKSYIGIVIPVILSCIMVYFVSGYFRYYAIAVASGSMSPVFEKGAVVIVDQKYSDLNIGDIIAFKSDSGVIVVHRLIRFIKDQGNIYYYTKGDANNNEDDYKLSRENIIGVVKNYIPIIGYPTVWLSEL